MRSSIGVSLAVVALWGCTGDIGDKEPSPTSPARDAANSDTLSPALGSDSGSIDRQDAALDDDVAYGLETSTPQVDGDVVPESGADDGQAALPDASSTPFDLR